MQLLLQVLNKEPKVDVTATEIAVENAAPDGGEVLFSDVIADGETDEGDIVLPRVALTTAEETMPLGEYRFQPLVEEKPTDRPASEGSEKTVSVPLEVSRPANQPDAVEDAVLPPLAKTEARAKIQSVPVLPVQTTGTQTAKSLKPQPLVSDVSDTVELPTAKANSLDRPVSPEVNLPPIRPAASQAEPAQPVFVDARPIAQNATPLQDETAAKSDKAAPELIQKVVSEVLPDRSRAGQVVPIEKSGTAIAQPKPVSGEGFESPQNSQAILSQKPAVPEPEVPPVIRQLPKNPPPASAARAENAPRPPGILAEPQKTKPTASASAPRSDLVAEVRLVQPNQVSAPQTVYSLQSAPVVPTVVNDPKTFSSLSGAERAAFHDEALPPLAPVEGNDTRGAREASAPRLDPAPRPVLTQLVQAAKSAIDGMIEVKLSPEELGRVRLALTTVESGMTVLVTAERAETLDLIRRNIDLFAADLAEQGFTDLSFSFGDEASGQGENASDHNSEAASAFTAREVRGAHDPQLDAYQITPDGRVDLRL